MTVYTLFGQPAGPASIVSDNLPYTLGVQFSVAVSGGTLTGIWWYSASGAATLPDTIALYQVSGTSLVTSQAASWSGAAGSGWVRAAVTSPPSLTASAAYVACVLDASPGGTGSNWYSATSHYWDSGAGQNGITNGPLSAPNNAGTANGQDVFNQNSVLAFPASSFHATNYWVDPEVTASGAAAGSLVVTPSFTVARVHGHFRTASRTVAPSFTAAPGGVPHTRAAARTVTPSFSAVRVRGHFRAGSLTVTPVLAAAPHRSVPVGLFFSHAAIPGLMVPGEAEPGFPQGPVPGPAAVLTAGVPYFRWAAGGAYFRWVTGDAYLRWDAGTPYLS